MYAYEHAPPSARLRDIHRFDSVVPVDAPATLENDGQRRLHRPQPVGPHRPAGLCGDGRGGRAPQRSGEAGATLKGPLLLGPNCFVAAGAYLRGGNWVAADCSFGPGTELKSSFVLRGTKLVHFNFVGDSILGEDVNLEAGSIICKYRNERADKDILVHLDGALHPTGVQKFGGLVGDQARIGARYVAVQGYGDRPHCAVRPGNLEGVGRHRR